MSFNCGNRVSANEEKESAHCSPCGDSSRSRIPLAVKQRQRAVSLPKMYDFAFGPEQPAGAVGTYI